jgi:hypothetical protein
MECLGLHNKPTAEVHPGHMLTGPKEEEKEEEGQSSEFCNPNLFRCFSTNVYFGTY